MDDELEKIDLLRSRFKVGYDDARSALNKADGDVVVALSVLERKRGGRKDLLALGAEIADDFQKAVAGGPIRRLRIKYGNKLLHESPVAITAAAAAAIALAALLITRLVIEVDKDEEGTAK